MEILIEWHNIQFFLKRIQKKNFYAFKNFQFLR
jgi:hypothetical protein